jgi:circadian clock protein KaiC
MSVVLESPTDRISTGVEGLDAILRGGLTPSRMYLLEGAPGTGKTTFGLRFLMAGAAAGEPGLYITLSETTAELAAVVQSHGWTLDGIHVHELGNDVGLMAEAEQSILHPSEIELGETVRAMTDVIDRLDPRRVVFDSLSEMRLLAQDPLRYRRQILGLKQFFAGRQCTVLLLDDKTSEPTDLQLHSIAHGVISLEQKAGEFGAERRALRVVKMRGLKFEGGWHDFLVDTGVLEVFPRLIAARHHTAFDTPLASTGLDSLDAMLGGGLAAGTSVLLLGPSGAGKTTTAVRCMLSALQRGECADYYLFDEGLATLLARSRNLGMALDGYIESGHLIIHQIDPASLSPGEFASRVVSSVKTRKARFVAIDSLNAYVHAMPGQSFLMLHMHELLTFLNQQGVMTMLIVGQHGLVGEVRSDIDLSYLSDSIVLYRFFETNSQVRTAISVLKSRTGQNQRSIRELRLGRPTGIQVGDELRGFDGVLAGAVVYTGSTPMLTDAQG